MAVVYACAATCTARVTESKSSPKPRVAEQGWPGASLAALSTKVPPFFARPLAEHFLRRKAPDICAPQAKKISVAGQPTHFCDEIGPLHARTCSWWSSQRLQLKQRSSSLQPAEHRLHHTLARSARSVPAWMSPLNLQPWESTPESTPGWDGTAEWLSNWRAHPADTRRDEQALRKCTCQQPSTTRPAAKPAARLLCPKCSEMRVHPFAIEFTAISRCIPL